MACKAIMSGFCFLDLQVEINGGAILYFRKHIYMLYIGYSHEPIMVSLGRIVWYLPPTILQRSYWGSAIPTPSTFRFSVISSYPIFITLPEAIMNEIEITSEMRL